MSQPSLDRCAPPRGVTERARGPSEGQPPWSGSHRNGERNVTRAFMLLTAAFITATLVGCSAVLADPPASSGPGLPTSSPTASADVTESLAPFICALPISGAATTPRAQITDLRVGEHAGFDRIVFEFTAETPAYTIER